MFLTLTRNRRPVGSRRLSPRPPTLLLLLLAVATGVPSAASALSLERPPYLQLGTPNSVVVRWRTDTPSESMLRYGPAPGELTTVIHPPGTRTEHEVAIQGLSPQTVYYYSVGTSTETLAGGDADHYFRTSPPKGASSNFRIWVIGDSGTADATAAAVRDAYRNFARNDPADVWLMLGDNAYSSGEDAEYTEAVFQMYPRILRNSRERRAASPAGRRPTTPSTTGTCTSSPSIPRTPPRTWAGPCIAGWSWTSRRTTRTS
jgi:phosphodiesterase/alkaline phosphatase D-like protein